MTEAARPRRIITVGTGRDSNRSDEISPWLTQPELKPDPAASFVEYLRWMRSFESQDKDPKKMQILQMAQQNADYKKRLNKRNEQTRLIAGENTFEVTCPWRIRVGGHKGPESMLLPAFDALGMPYIPSSTLRGVARNQAIREKMAQKNLTWKDADRAVAKWFGHLDAKGGDRTGKVIFLDAYPLAETKSGGLAVDIATSIWRWEDQEIPKYDNAKPNSFLSLKDSKFLIAICPTEACDKATLQEVKAWLLRGLEAGVGSQVNAGYGVLTQQSSKIDGLEFFSVSFDLHGQLIHGAQKFLRLERPYKQNDAGHPIRNRQGDLQANTQAESEVRPIAFKSMLRYWFRVFALGVLEPRVVKEWEAIFFGAIDPKKYGWLSVQIREGNTSKELKKDPNPNGFGVQSGILVLRYSSEIEDQNQSSFKALMESLCWLMFHLGGVGQGARRPCYSRESRPKPPWWRGSTLMPDRTNDFWELPDDLKGFQKKFCKHLESFYRSLSELVGTTNHSQPPLSHGEVDGNHWTEAVDSNCQIIVCTGEASFQKPYALSTLHDEQFKVQNHKNYDSRLCGTTTPKPKPSPIWISDLGKYQVVTVFGATHSPRSDYLKQLRSIEGNFRELWPLAKS